MKTAKLLIQVQILIKTLLDWLKSSGIYLKRKKRRFKELMTW